MIKPPCGCGGSDSMTSWIRRLMQRDPYIYLLGDNASVRPGRKRFNVEIRTGENRRKEYEKRTGDEYPDVDLPLPSFSGEIVQQGSPPDNRSPGWVIWRERQDGSERSEALCWCGRWIDPRAEGQKLRYQRVWRDSRVAEEFARRLRYGIPQAWEWAAAGLFITAEVVATAVIVRFG